MNLLMNILWLLLGGIFTCIEYLIASLLMMITIIGIPFGLQTLKMSMLALMPFGKKVISCPNSGGCLSLTMNILWIFLGGIWISLSHLGFGIVLCITRCIILQLTDLLYFIATNKELFYNLVPF